MFPEAKLPNSLSSIVKENLKMTLQLFMQLCLTIWAAYMKTVLIKILLSCYVHEDTGFLLSESGFDDFSLCST